MAFEPPIRFVLVMRTGIDLKDEHPHISPLLQVMPWPYTRHMTDQELRAIYEYLRAVPCLVRADENPDAVEASHDADR